MSAAVYILAAVVAVLLVALVLCWMQPRRKAKLSGGTMTIDIECDSAKAMAQIAALTAAVERLDAAQRKAGLNLPVRDSAKQYPSVGDPVEFHIVGEKLPRKLNTNPEPNYKRPPAPARLVPPSGSVRREGELPRKPAKATRTR